MDYRKTLNVTLSDNQPGAMPQRANLPAREPEIQRFWDEIDLYRLSLEKEAPRGAFVLHDGPPYSNGDIHLGHALNKIAKDIIVKHRTMCGYCVPYVPGWDNHGMPIENNVARAFREAGETPDRVAMRRRCREYATTWVAAQKEQFRRLGVRGDWDHPYLTMTTSFEARIVDVFGQLAERGYVYRGLKPVLWCAACETALADAEVEYREHTSRSIYVRFPVHRDPAGVFGGDAADPPNTYVLIWTTTPWTIPANLAVAVRSDANYVVLEAGGDRYLVAEPMADAVARGLLSGAAPRVVRRIRGSDLEGVVAWHPLFRRTSPIVFADYVTMEDGTGVVHTAPGHGKEDFETGQRYGLEVLCPVGPSGAFTAEAGQEFEGARILGGEADLRVVGALRQAGHLLADAPYAHSYPHCWRCHNPLLFRATVQWFMNIDHDGHRERSLEAIRAVRWFPPVSANRIRSMVAARPDWCLSRQRAWGVGIPAFYCRTCGSEILTMAAIDAVRDLVAARGSDAWYEAPAAEILPDGLACARCGGTAFDKETDILDVWFDSGSTHLAVLDSGEWPRLSWPASLYLEGSDQHRGWFNSSLMISVALRGRAPYDAVITNGWTLDETGRAMHKSLGNAVSPNDVVRNLGADILRLWVASTDYFEDVRCSDEIIDQVAQTYRLIRNTLRFLVNNLYDFRPERDGVREARMLSIDWWALAQLDRVVAECAAAYEAFEFHRVYHAVSRFCAVELSAFYLDVLKDRLYCSAPNSLERRSAQTALHALASTLAGLLAPVLSHTAEEVWQLLGLRDRAESVQLTNFPEARSAAYLDVLALWEPVLALREAVNLAIESARQEKRLRKPLEAGVTLTVDPATAEGLLAFPADLAAVFRVSHLAIIADPEIEAGQARAEAGQAPGAKCARCWLVREDVGVSKTDPDLCARCADVVSQLVPD